MIYAGLASLSEGCPPDRGRLHTCYSPVRRSPAESASTLPAAPRLACVKPAASVHPEPGSNSPLSVSCFLFSSKYFSVRRFARIRRPTAFVLTSGTFFRSELIRKLSFLNFPCIFLNRTPCFRCPAACLGSKMSLCNAFVPESGCKVITNFFPVQIFQ